MFSVTVKYFGSYNSWGHSFMRAEDMYSYLDAVRPFIYYSRVTDEKSGLTIERHYVFEKGEEMTDETEGIRREMVSKINAESAEREALEKKYFQVWNTEELSRDFEVKGFMAPLVVVVRKADRKTGTLTFQHSPRYYFNFKPTN